MISWDALGGRFIVNKLSQNKRVLALMTMGLLIASPTFAADDDTSAETNQ